MCIRDRVYGVSLQDEIDQNTLEGVSEDYITAHTENGKVNFYSNKYSGNQQNSQTVGDAKVEFTPAGDNPFYFVQEDTPIYNDAQGQNPVRNFDENATYYVPVTYYEGNTERTVYVPRAASTMAGYVAENYINGYHLTAGAPRLGNIEEFVQNKEANNTGTAQTSFYPTFEGTDVSNGKFVVYQMCIRDRRKRSGSSGLRKEDHYQDRSGRTGTLQRRSDSGRRGIRRAADYGI